LVQGTGARKPDDRRILRKRKSCGVKVLRPEDWAEMDARLEDRKDPLFDSVVEEKFRSLQRTILRWEQETEESRAAMARTQP
jgi:hypothetical protein